MIALQTPTGRTAARRRRGRPGHDDARRSGRGFDASRGSPDAIETDADAEAVVAGAAEARLFIECPACAYEPPEQDAAPRGRCPKCGATAWRRVWQSGRSLADVK
jgi:hypothetical protein